MFNVSKRGQAWGIDLAVGLLIFVSGIIFFYYYAVNESGSEKQDLLFMQQEAKLISGNLFTEGTPRDWNETNVIRIGIMDEGRINQSKLDYFYNLAENQYQQSKVFFGVIDEYYVFFPNGVDIASVGTVESIGNDSLAGAENIVVSERVVIYDNQIVSMKVYVWN